MVTFHQPISSMQSRFLLTVSILFVLYCNYNRSFGQLKIGTNSTEIETTSNLEVEGSTAGRKFKINKTTGQVTIADGTQTTNGVLVTDADGNSKWSAVRPEHISKMPRLFANGTFSVELVNGQRVDLSYPSLIHSEGGFQIPLSGIYNVIYNGWYNIETSLKIENSEGCTGTSVMGLEVSLIMNNDVITIPIVDEKLTPVYQDKYITKAAVQTSLIAGTSTSFSILPTIKSPQAGCSIKVTAGTYQITYIP